MRGADAVYTDVWASMGAEHEAAERRRAFAGFRVTRELLREAPDALVMHCLPAHRGEEIDADVIDGPQSVVFDQAENRMHAQQALLVHLLNARRTGIPMRRAGGAPIERAGGATPLVLSGGRSEARAVGRVIEGPGEGVRAPAVRDDDLLPARRQDGEGAAHLRDHAARDRAVGDQRLDGRAVEPGDLPALRVLHPVGVAEQHQPTAQGGRQTRRDLVGVDVADLPVLVERERRDDGTNPPRSSSSMSFRCAPTTRPTRPSAGMRSATDQAAVDAADADRRRAEPLQRGDQLGVDEAAQHRDRDRQGLVVGHAAPVLEPALDAQPVQPAVRPLPAAVDDDQRLTPGRARRRLRAWRAARPASRHRA